MLSTQSIQGSQLAMPGIRSTYGTPDTYMARMIHMVHEVYSKYGMCGTYSTYGTIVPNL